MKWPWSRPRKRFATGGTVRYEDVADLITLPGGYLVPAPAAKPRDLEGERKRLAGDMDQSATRDLANWTAEQAAAGASVTMTVDNSVEGRYTQPTGFVEFSGELTEEQVRRFRQAWQDLNGSCAPNSAAKSCTCDLVIYSKCRCGWRAESGA